MNQKGFIPLVIILALAVLAVSGAAFVLTHLEYWGGYLNQSSNNWIVSKDGVIYYGISAYKNWSNEQLQADCENRGGIFNTCGSLCEECVAAVCSPVCDLNKNIETSAAINLSTWKTYRNEKFGFEVQYPSDWEAKEIKTGGQIIFYIGFKPKNLTGETLANVIGSKGKLVGYLGVQSEKQHNDLLFTLQNSGGSDYLNLENQILSTFKFVEPK